MSLTVACVFVQGEYPYTVEYVARLRAAVGRWLTRPFRFVCLTDQPHLMPDGVEAIPIKKLQGLALWSKLHLFNPKVGLTGRVLYLDLDTLVVNSLDPIVDYPAAFALCEDVLGGSPEDKRGRQIVRRFNSSVMVFEGGAHGDLFRKWTPKDAERLSTDQDWIAEQSAYAVAMPEPWFPRISKVTPPFSPVAKVLLVKKPKNHIAAQRWAWFDALWRAA